MLKHESMVKQDIDLKWKQNRFKSHGTVSHLSLALKRRTDLSELKAS